MTDATDRIKESAVGEEIFNEGYEKGYNDAKKELEKGEVIKVEELPKVKIWQGKNIHITQTAITEIREGLYGEACELIYEGPIRMIETDGKILKFEEVKENE